MTEMKRKRKESGDKLHDIRDYCMGMIDNNNENGC